MDIVRRKCPLTTLLGLISPRRLAFFCYKPGFLKLQGEAGGMEWGVEGQRELSVLRERRQQGSQTGIDWSI
jgi:hypothetical protein